ncbi:MAG: hypothetical protein QNK63_09480 [Flavobacteriales bacterium]|jgi:hypothetical protein
MENSDLKFTEKQKEAAVFGLYQMSLSDNDLAEDEIVFLKRIGSKLGNAFSHFSISTFITENSSKQISELRRFSKEQKEWFILAAFSMVNPDTILFDDGFTVSTAFLKVMGISNEEAFHIVSQRE